VNTAWFDYLLQAGVPAGLGVFIVFYLLKYMIPGQQEMFKQSLSDLQDTFRDTLQGEQKTHSADLKNVANEHREAMRQLRDTLITEGQQTRQALSALTLQTGNLSEAVFKLYGQATAKLPDSNAIEG
jgi:hypothetical protein